MNIRYLASANKPISFLILFFLIGCGVGREVNTTTTSMAKIESTQEINELNTRLISRKNSNTASSNTALPSNYLVGPDDLLEVKVLESDKLSTTSRVSPNGEITLPLLGSVKVDGLTAREAERKTEDLLRKGKFIDDPHVNIFVKENRSKVVSVVGYVTTPGTYDLLGKRDIVDVLAAANGLRDNAGSSAYITRTNEDGSKESFVVDLDELLIKGNEDINLPLKAGDVVYVPVAGTMYVEGAVKRPGSYPIKPGTTVAQAVAVAGGKAGYAGDDVTLVRYLGDGKREAVKLNLEEIQMARAEDPIIKDRDAIVVNASAAKRVLYGLRLNFLMGLVGFGYAPPEVLLTQ